MNNLVLVRFMDEIDHVPVSGFKLMSAREWEKFDDGIVEKSFPHTFKLGKKERRYNFAGEYLECFSVSEVTQTWADNFRKQFSTGEFGFIVWLPLVKEEEEIII